MYVIGHMVGVQHSAPIGLLLYVGSNPLQILFNILFDFW